MGMRIHYDATKYQRARNVHVSLHLNVAFDFRIAGNIKQRSGNFGTAIRHLDVRTASLNKDGTVFQGYGCVFSFLLWTQAWLCELVPPASEHWGMHLPV